MIINKMISFTYINLKWQDISNHISFRNYGIVTIDNIIEIKDIFDKYNCVRVAWEMLHGNVHKAVRNDIPIDYAWDNGLLGFSKV